MAKKKVTKKVVKKINHKKVETKKREGFSFKDADFSKENIIEGGVIRPGILMISFATFIGSMFLLLLGSQGNETAQKWGGSLIIFSFVLIMQSIYTSLTDEPSIFRTLNLGFKIVLFAAEIMAFNYLLLLVCPGGACF